MSTFEKDGIIYEMKRTDNTTVRRIPIGEVSPTTQPPTQLPSDEKEKKTTKKKTTRKKRATKKKTAKK